VTDHQEIDMSVPSTAPQTAAAPDGGNGAHTLSGPTLTRRRLLAGVGALGAGGLVGGGLLGRHLAMPARSSTTGAAPAAVRPGRGIAVLITLYGGNDGLNTVVPASDPAYRAGRPPLGYSPTQVLPLADGLGLNPVLTGLKGRWDRGQLAVVRGVGYPDPSLSHFQSMDIWQSAAANGAGPGWLGRWLDTTGRDPLRAISVGASLSPALRGDTTAATAITSSTITLPGRPPLLAGFAACSQPGPDRSPLAGQVAASGSDLLAVRSSLATLTGRATPGPVPTSTTSPGAPTTAAAGGAAATGGAAAKGATAFAGQLATVATLINAGAPTQVYQVSLSSFDTHADEKANHERLLAELDHGLDTFLTSVGQGPRAADVVAFTVSEFGRRVAQNASGGTDHGSAAPILVAGHGVRGGAFYGDEPSLTALDPSGNLVHTVDFRSVYATVLDRVLGVDPSKVLGAAYPTLGFL